MESPNDLQQEIVDLKRQLLRKDAYIQQLEECMKQAQRRQFSSSSEKYSPDQQSLFNEAEELVSTEEESDVEEKAIEVSSHTRKKKPRVSIPAGLPREEIIHDLENFEKICPHDGAGLKEVGSEDHEQLDIIPAQIKVIRHVRKKYACPCCKQYMVTAKKPKHTIEKSIASPGLLAYIATNKFCDALSAMFNRIGITLNRSNLANWMVRCGESIQPIINLLQDQLHEAAVLHMDETPIQVLNEPDKKAQSKSYMWLTASYGKKPVILFHYASTRSQSIPVDLLSSKNKSLMVDGYEGYQKACDDYTIIRLACWAHARRKFVDAQKIQPKGKTGKADQAIAFIQKLYRIEKALKEESIDKRYEIRQQQAKPILDNIKKWLANSLPHVPPKTALGIALHYLHNQWDRLVRYLENGAYPIDNNPAENAIRPFVVGRKNWLFSTSQAGAKASANLYGLIETAKANDLNPYEYLKHIFKVLPNMQTVEEIEQLLPWHSKNFLKNS